MDGLLGGLPDAAAVVATLSPRRQSVGAQGSPSRVATSGRARRVRFPAASTNTEMMSFDLAEYFGFGPEGEFWKRLRGHRSDVTTCPCLDCRKVRGVRAGYRAQAAAVHLIFHLRWWRWIAGERRKHWLAINEADPGKLEKEDYDGRG